MRIGTAGMQSERPTGFFVIALLAILSAAAGVSVTNDILEPDSEDLLRRQSIEQQIQMRASYLDYGMKALQRR